MQGHGYAPPPPKRPSTAVLVVLRVVFVAVALLSIGFLAWVATLRAAIVTRRAADWWVFAGSVVVLGISFAFLSTDHTDDFSTPNGDTGMIILLLNAVACVGYYLYADIRHFSPFRGPHAGRPPTAPGYGYPQPASPYTAATVPSTPQPPYGAPPMPYTPPPGPPAPAPLQRPAPARIDQVRAELDELSDYLRKHPGQQGGGLEGGR
ncbi:hypothetical protein [Streptomyces sp. NPDC006739]|uniref:hypothetical protein n=1 Tax=Streptomyces sp. NPDC006739 TaxID=3364763 RepID=UPI00367C9358